MCTGVGGGGGGGGGGLSQNFPDSYDAKGGGGGSEDVTLIFYLKHTLKTMCMWWLAKLVQGGYIPSAFHPTTHILLVTSSYEGAMIVLSGGALSGLLSDLTPIFYCRSRLLLSIFVS